MSIADAIDTNGTGPEKGKKKSLLSAIRESPPTVFVSEETTLVVRTRKPNKTEFVRVHPELVVDAEILDYEDDEGNRDDYLIYPEPLVKAAIRRDAPTLIRPVRIFVTINRSGTLFLWPARLPTGESRQGETWYTSALEIAEMAKDHWVRVEADRGSSAYRPRKANADFNPPDWGDLDFDDLLSTAFRGQYLIDTVDHPVLQKLRGDI